MTVCNRCRKDTKLFGSFNKQTNRCGKCEHEVQQALGRFRTTFISYCGDGVLTDPEWQFLLQLVQRDNISKQEALAYIRSDAVQFLERSLVFAAADGTISSHAEITIRQLVAKLEIPPELSQPILNRLLYLKHLSNIRQGNLPIVQPSVRLDPGEVCHLEIPATFNQLNVDTSVTPVYGGLLATSRKILFLSQAGPRQILLNSIMKVSTQAGGVLLELAGNAGNYLYTVQDPAYTEAVIDTIVRMSGQDVSQTQRGRDNRHISPEIKAAVWQRDKGKCVECGEVNFLELDYIIPLSSGGPSTLNNLQLLCRSCFQKKSVKTWNQLPVVKRDRPGTGNLQPGTTGYLPQVARPGTGNLQPGQGMERPGTGNLQPGQGMERPGTGNLQPGQGEPYK